MNEIMPNSGGSIRVETEATQKISDRINLESGLTVPKAFPWINRPVVKNMDIIEEVRENAPTSENDVVGWMQESAADSAVLSGASEDYAKAGSVLDTASGDAYIPGVSMDSNFSWASKDGYDVRSDGNATVNAPIGNVTVVAPGKEKMIGRDFLGWASVPSTGRWIQWRGVLMRWRDLAERPIDNRVRFPNTDDFVAPQFFRVTPNRLIRNSARVTVTSDKNQTLTVVARSPGNYQSEITRFQQDIPKGQSEFTYHIFGTRQATDHVLEIQPEDDTKTVIDKLE